MILKIHKDILSKSAVLLVEDEESLRKSFKRVLECWVKKVYEAKNGEEALVAYKRYYPDIIITDIKMPKVNGLEFIEAIRKINQTVPIVAMSAYTDKEYLLKSIKLLLIEYLVKPIQENDLLTVLSSCASKLAQDLNEYDDFGHLGKYDFQNKSFIDANNETISLTTKEVELMELFIKNRGNLVTKQTIEDNIYMYNYAPSSALKNLIFKLRKKVGKQLIKSVGQLGYCLE